LAAEDRFRRILSLPLASAEVGKLN